MGHKIQVDVTGAVICVIASQIANLGESIVGASFQEKEGFQWVCFHVNFYKFLMNH